MSPIIIRKLSKTRQYFYSIILILAVSSGCFIFEGITGYHTAALILLVTVSLIAMVCDILPVLVSAVLSALIWNFFFIPPLYTFHIGKSEDILMYLMYFIIALLNAVLTIKIRQVEKKAQIREEKENLIKVYDSLLSALSTELRTPLASIIEAIGTFRNTNEKIDEKKRTDLVSEITKASNRLSQDVENLLNISKIESGMVETKNTWCDMNNLIYETIKRIKEPFITQRFDIQIPDSIPYFFIDHDLMEQVLINLIMNAVKYSPDNTVVTICSTCVIDRLIITVEDEGPGFTKDQIEKGFDKDYRLINPGMDGIGIGLSIVKGLVEAHHGSISLNNKNEGGAIVTLTLPAKTSYRNKLNEIKLF